MYYVMAVLSLGLPAASSAKLPPEAGPPALSAPHMPDRLHTFVWRNWESVDAERMAAVLGTTADNVRAIGRSMGLPDVKPPGDLQIRRGYVGLIRRNWHLLPFNQLLQLLGWDEDHLAYTLREDDFLWAKLGSLKPTCPPLKYEPPTPEARRRAAEIKALVETEFGPELATPAEPRFDFIRQLSAPLPKSEELKAATSQSKSESADAGSEAEAAPIRFLYSYFAPYGDALLNPELDPYPDGLLQRLSAAGVNGVWMHTVLRQLAPSPDFPEFGQGHEVRLANLRKLVERAARYGVKIYLYSNEPRAMPSEFFKDRPELAGVREGDYLTMCTSTPQVRRWLTDSYAYVFRNVPGLGGVFTISGSENLTNCCSHQSQAGCPRCSKRPPAEVIAEANAAIAEGVWRGNPQANVLVWDWGWPDAWAEAIINGLPKQCYFQSVSEWSLPISRGGIAGAVGEYSISSVGPGPRAQRHWAFAKAHGMRTVAKVQVNCSWELSAVPYLPVMDLVARHCANLAERDIDGLMLSWTLGGYPSPNLQLVERFFDRQRPRPSVEEAVSDLARERYGPEAAALGRQAWSEFSAGLAEYPYHGSLLYNGPLQVGPGNLLYAQPTGYRSSMVGFPYDDVNSWRAIYPPEVLAGQLEKVAAGWQTGLTHLRAARDKATDPHTRAALDEDLRLAEAACIHFKSSANQVRFILARDARGQTEKRDEIRRVLEEEIALAKRTFTLTRADSRIGFEATNHYYYLPLDLVEKVIDCRYLLEHEFVDGVK
jgi:hypothetical protein